MNAVAGNAALAALLRRKGIRDARVLAAMEATDRALFVAPAFAERAYEDEALPIECAQTLSQPYVVAAMTEALAVGPDMRVLEIGAGSGYQTAILARLAAHVYAVEAHEELARQARARLSRLGLENVTLRVGDGALGWPEAAPFDRLLAAAAAPELPQAWWEQIAVW
jgi:protein-L-isoaspartate(D-aspartate) O-methyltransferase